MHARFWLSLLSSWVIAIAASHVRADSAGVTVLGVRSADGDDQLERHISHALHGSARTIEGYRVSEREVSLAQMSLANGCEEVDIPCLKEIAATLSADRLIFGNLLRSGDKVRITLFNFDARSGQIDASTERTLTAAQLVEPALSEAVLELTQRLAGKRAANLNGKLRITGNEPGASVTLDEKPAGQLGSNGELLLEAVPEGPHAVSVTSTDGANRVELKADVHADVTTTLRARLTLTVVETSAPAAAPEPLPAEPPAQDNRRLRRGLGWMSIGVAAGFAAATIYSWVRIEAIKHDAAITLYRDQFPSSGPGSTSDVCKDAMNQHLAKSPTKPAIAAEQAAIEEPATKLCKEAHRLETLQWVFIGGTAAFTGVGTWLLWTGYHGQKRTISLRPSFGRQQASLRATLRF